MSGAEESNSVPFDGAQGCGFAPACGSKVWVFEPG
jgi:hypothetical protein